MRTSAPKLIRRPSRSVATSLLALLLLAVGGLGIWLCGGRLFDGAWPAGTTAAVNGFGSSSLKSTLIIVLACIVAVCGLAMIIAAVWPGAYDRTDVLPDDVAGQTAIARKDLAALVRRNIEQVDGVHSATVRIRGSRVNVKVLSVLDNLEPVREAAHNNAVQALEVLKPEGIQHCRVRVQKTS